jgi:hypothetical protein
MPIFMLMIRMFLMFLIKIGVIIMLLYLLVMMLHLILMPCLHLALHMLMVGIDLGAIMLLPMRLGRHQLDQLRFIKHVMLHLYCYICKNDKLVARNLGPKCKRDKTCIWVPKSVVTNLVGPNKSWVPKTQA